MKNANEEKKRPYLPVLILLTGFGLMVETLLNPKASIEVRLTGIFLGAGFLLAGIMLFTGRPKTLVKPVGT